MPKDLHESEIQASRQEYLAYLEALKVVVSFQIQGTRDDLATTLPKATEELVKRMTRDRMIGIREPRRGLQEDLLEALDLLMPNQEIRTNKIS